jgi:hypothetical protein
MPVPDFSPGEVLTAAAMDSIGLWLVKTQTIGAGVASVAVTGAFNSDYENYKIVISGGASSTDIGILFQLGATTTGYYGTYIFSPYALTTVSGFNTNNGPNWSVGSATADGIQVNIDLLSPNLAKRTSFSGFNQNSLTNAGPLTGYIANATAYTGFTIIATSGSLTGGTIRVYGYRN